MGVVTRISGDPFRDSIAFAFETLRRETVGSVYGEVHERKSGNRKILVEKVYPDQMAKRCPTWTSRNYNAHERFEAINGESFGLLHSHPDETVFLGFDDLLELKERYPQGISIVVALNRAERLIEPHADDFLVTVSFQYRGEKYRARVGVYYLESYQTGNYRKRRSRISVPIRELRNYF